MRAVPGRIRLWREAARADRPAISILDDASLQWPVDGLATSRCLGSLATLFTLYPRSGLREVSFFPFNNVLSAEMRAVGRLALAKSVDGHLVTAEPVWLGGECLILIMNRCLKARAGGVALAKAFVHRT